MKPRGKHDSVDMDEDATPEREALDRNPTDTDIIDKDHRVSIDYTGEFATGSVDHDDRGQARWKWNSESTPAGDTERTFDLLKALNNDALTIEGSADQAPEQPKRQGGYNPYDVSGGKTKPKAKPPKK